MENFFESDDYYESLEDFVTNLFDSEEEVMELDDDMVFNCVGSRLEPIIMFDEHWIADRVEEERFSEHDSEKEYLKLLKVLKKNIDFDKIEKLVPQLHYENTSDKFVITKQDLLEIAKKCF